MTDQLFASPRTGVRFEDCHFYHVMNLPGIGQTHGEWDLREGVEDYLGRFDFRNKRVLEIGPASGYLTAEMERRGAQVDAVEVLDDPGWDFVPYPDTILEPHMPKRRRHMKALKDSWWLVHQLLSLKARIHYGNAYNLPEALGDFDVAILAAVLTHCRSPVQIMEQCARKAKSIIVVETFRPDLEGRPVCILQPTWENKDWGTWWSFSTDFFGQFLRVMGFDRQELIIHSQKYHGVPVRQFTIVAHKSD